MIFQKFEICIKKIPDQNKHYKTSNIVPFKRNFVVIYDNCIIGNNVIINSSSVIGADGFGYEKNEKGEWEKFQHPFKTGLATTDPYSDVMGGGIYVEPYEQDIYSYYSGESGAKDSPKTLEEGRTVWEKEASETVAKQKEFDLYQL